jgi:hypothetical protein
MTSDESGEFKKFRNFEAAMGVVHLIQPNLMLAPSNDFSLTVSRSNLELKPRHKHGSPHRDSFQILTIIISILLIEALGFL